ncbi:uncharacterized protein LOC62_06G008338 [Vanrija pseudolonga]|uniref:Uncharacterized protein n=1 Tax=Vanrija pseudolonga TaxID=143232 RepID=A0AAF0YHN2_9TREE|nr:hypothetical protein LOC62_06G008338 [Vanrija pseudolonga]
MLAVTLAALVLAQFGTAQETETLLVSITTYTPYSYRSDLPDKTDAAYLDKREEFWRAERKHAHLLQGGVIFFTLLPLIAVCLLLPILILYERDTRRMERLVRARREAHKALGVEPAEETAYPPSYGHVRAAGVLARLGAMLPFLGRARAQATGAATFATRTTTPVDASHAAAPTMTYTTGPFGTSSVCFGTRTWVSPSGAGETGYYSTVTVPCGGPRRTTLYVTASSSSAVIPGFLSGSIVREQLEITKWTIAFAVGSTVPLILMAAWALNIRRRRRRLRLLLGDDVAWFSPQNSRKVEAQPIVMPL